jgi:predicted  nucleic acid-binding Zn-ribbon protein
VAEVPVLTEALYQVPRSDYRNFVIATIFALSSIISAAISVAGVVLQLSIPSLFPALLSFTMACASAVVHLGNRWYEIKLNRESEEWHQCRQAFQDFVNQFQRWKEGNMFSALRGMQDATHSALQQQTQQIAQIRQKLETGKQASDAKIEKLEEENADFKQRFEALERFMSSTHWQADQLAIQAEKAAATPVGGAGSLEDFKQATEILVAERFAEGMLYEDIRKEAKEKIDEAIATHQVSESARRHAQQASLAAAQSGN